LLGGNSCLMHRGFGALALTAVPFGINQGSLPELIYLERSRL